MCTLAIYLRRFREFPVVVAANRDEYLDRPAEPPRVLGITPRIVGGRDVHAGGTWLAASERGLVSGVLNRRVLPQDDAPRSRGELPLLMLQAATAAVAASRLGTIDSGAYRPFNLLVADRERAWVAQNRDEGLVVTPLEPGVHLLTNLDVNDPRCSKITRSHQAFERVGDEFAAHRDVASFRAALGIVLGDHTTHDADPLGALCVHAGGYGTRCSSLLALTRAGRWKHWFADGPPCSAPYEPSAAP